MPPFFAPLRSALLALVAILCCTACQPAPTPVTPRSSWGQILTLAQAEQSAAPALWADPARLVAAWIGADDEGIHQDARQWIDEALTPVTVLPLPPTHPYAQSLLPASARGLHLLWLDANQSGETQLYSALVTSQLQVERGPTPISESLALHYAATAEPNGRLWVAWSGGLLSEPVLSLRALDEAGRPQPSQQIAFNAEYPALIQTNEGTVLLFWLQQGQLKRALLRNGIVSEAIALTSSVYLGAGDRLHSLSAGLDQTHAYVFWNITRASGQDETWFASGEISADTWAQPVPLRIDAETSTPLETGFNTGAASGAVMGELPLTWAAPLSAQYDLLPIAVQSPAGLGIIYFRAGIAVGYQEVVSGVRLIGAPALTGDRNRDLYLAWAEPSATSEAELHLTSTRR